MLVESHDTCVRGMKNCSVQFERTGIISCKTSNELKMKRNSPNNSICSLAKLFGDSIALIDNEILIKDLEDLSALEIRHCMPVVVVLFLLRK